MQVAVAGGSGFLGRHVVDRLMRDGHMVRTVQRRGPHRAGVEHVPLDAVTAEPDDWGRALSGCSAVVNLMGIKRERGTATFEAVHVRAVRRLLEGCRRAGVERMVHISVVVARPHDKSPYHDTKWRGEEAVRASGLQWTVLRPGVIHGPGDDLVGHLSRMLRVSGVFPVVAPGTQPMQPVDVEDVAEAVARCLVREASAGQTLDVVGPERMPLTEVVRRVADAMGRNVRFAPMPAALMRVPVAVMGAVQAAPLSTPAQLRMLKDGLPGDPEPARRVLGLEPRPFAARRIGQALPPRPPPQRWFLRMGEPWPVETRSPPVATALVLWGAAAALLAWAFLGSAMDLWSRLVAAIMLLGVLGVVAVGHKGTLGRPTAAALVLGVGAGVALAVLGWLLMAFPAVAGQAAAIRAWPGERSLAVVAATVAVAVVAEEVFWRGGVQRLLGSRIPAGAAVVAASALYASAHVVSGSWLLVLAAAGMGLVWGVLYAATRNLWVAVVCHLVWDLLLLGGAPTA